MPILMLRLQGVMQAWGGHTYEDYRPSHLFPTRSGLEGLLAACLGIDRDNLEQQQALSESFTYAVRADHRKHPPRKIIDFHTVMAARKVDGKSNPHPIISRREYLCDSRFTVALDFKPNAQYDLATVAQAVQKPVYTPVLGRRSCPLTAPLYAGQQTADDLHAALKALCPHQGTIYSELEMGSSNHLVIRDCRLFQGKRQFKTRIVYIHVEEHADVSE